MSKLVRVMIIIDEISGEHLENLVTITKRVEGDVVSAARIAFAQASAEVIETLDESSK
jgi:hypothetical protein